MNIPELLLDLSIHFNAFIRGAASTLNLTASQAFHLISIPCEGISMSHLSNRLGLDTSTLTRNIQKLEKLKMVKRERDAYDRRIQNIFLTRVGRVAVENIDARLNEINRSLVEGLDIDMQEGVLEVLEKLVWLIDCLREEK